MVCSEGGWGEGGEGKGGERRKQTGSIACVASERTRVAKVQPTQPCSSWHIWQQKAEEGA